MNERISQVIEYIKQHLHEPMPAHQLAHMACLSMAQFYATFKKHTGQSPGQMITQLRMQKAYRRLSACPASVQALSEQCGYRNYESFSRIFKTTYGLAPDDLARVVKHIKSDQSAVEQLYVMKVESMDEEVMKTRIFQWLNARQVPKELLSEATAYQVRQKQADDTDHDAMIKNKYIITKANHLLTLPEAGS